MTKITWDAQGRRTVDGHLGEEHLDLANYEKDIEAGVPRQLARLRYDLTPDAYDQLKGAFIFHYTEAWAAFKYYGWSLLTGRCIACGKRHLKPILYTVNGENRGGCYNGFTVTLRVAPMGWWYAGKNGDD
jgi:hypothetical protein